MSSVKKMAFKQPYELSKLISCNDGQLSSKTIVYNQYCEMVLYGIGRDYELEGNSNQCELVLYVAQGEGILKCDGLRPVKEGEVVCIPANNDFCLSTEKGAKVIVNKFIEPKEKKRKGQGDEEQPSLSHAIDKKKRKNAGEFNWNVFKF